MKKKLLFTGGVVLSGMLLFLFSCKNPSSNPKKKFDVRLNEFNRTLRKADKTLDMMDALAAQKALVEADYRAGKITEAEARRRLAAINSRYNSKIAGKSVSSSGLGMPAWAKSLGLTEPEHMKLDKSLSQVTGEDSYGGGFNSLTLVYKGNYQQALAQAKRIATLANIPLAPEYRTAMEMKQKYGEEILKGVVYMNFEPGRKSNSKYNIAITVDANGILTISAADADKMDREMKAFQKEK